MRGLYIHVPFCVRKCRYCDFYSLPARLDSVEAYIDAILRESRTYVGMSFQTLYLGGGTPSLLGADSLRRLINGLKKSFDLSGLVEATIEANPESATPELFETAHEIGINRVSIGVQSINDSELQSVGRIHNAAQGLQAVKTAQILDFKSVSADLIVGLPGQTWLTLNKSLETLINLGVPHISVYCLAVEEGTPLAQNPPANLPPDDMQAELFEQARSFLTELGFIHYEISNFAREGFECQHNLNYWHGGEYLGLGSAAASHIDGVRFRNRPELDIYLKDPAGLKEYDVRLNPRDKACEEAMLRLRLLQEGIPIDEMTAKFGRINLEELIKRLDGMASEGHLICDGYRYRLSPSRILTSNPIFANVLC